MRARASTRVAFGKPLAEQGVVQQWIAESRIEIEQARLLTLKTAWLIDTRRQPRAPAPRSRRSRWSCRAWRCDVIDRAIQVHGGARRQRRHPAGRACGPALRTLRLADGPDEVHIRSVARAQLRPYR